MAEVRAAASGGADAAQQFDRSHPGAGNAGQGDAGARHGMVSVMAGCVLHDIGCVRMGAVTLLLTACKLPAAVFF
jgi:hypothetical protein